MREGQPGAKDFARVVLPPARPALRWRDLHQRLHRHLLHERSAQLIIRPRISLWNAPRRAAHARGSDLRPGSQTAETKRRSARRASRRWALGGHGPHGDGSAAARARPRLGKTRRSRAEQQGGIGSERIGPGRGSHQGRADPIRDGRHGAEDSLAGDQKEFPFGTGGQEPRTSLDKTRAASGRSSLTGARRGSE